MAFAEKYFGKILSEIRAPDILQFFRQSQREGQHLEFKSGQVRIDKILKEISAFLNSEGGLLIIGAPREMDVPGLVESRNSFGEPDPSHIASSDLIYAAIQRQLVPLPTGIFIEQVLFNSGSVFLIEVRPSINPPHQINHTGTYYLREGDVSRPATHEELEKLFFEKRMPDLKLRIVLERKVGAVKLHFYVINESTRSARMPQLEVHVKPVLEGEKGRIISRMEYPNPYLPQGVEWYETLEIKPQDPVFYIRIDFWCRDVPVRSKAAFVKVRKREAEVLQAYDSVQELYFNAHDFYYQYSYLLDH